MTDEEIIKSFPQMKSIVLLMSKLTHSPYITYNEETTDYEAYIFDDEKYAGLKAESLCEEMIPVECAVIENKDMLQTIADFYLFGIDSFHFYNESEHHLIQLDAVVRCPDYSSLPVEQRPLQNPFVQLGMLNYMQEARKDSSVRNPEKMKKLEQEMLSSIMRGKFYLPIVEKEEEDGKKINQLIFITNAATGARLLPVFTDLSEIRRFKTSITQFKLAVTDIDKMAEMPLPEDLKAFVVNPSGANTPLPVEFIKKIRMSYSWK